MNMTLVLNRLGNSSEPELYQQLKNDFAEMVYKVADKIASEKFLQQLADLKFLTAMMVD